MQFHTLNVATINHQLNNKSKTQTAIGLPLVRLHLQHEHQSAATQAHLANVTTSTLEGSTGNTKENVAQMDCGKSKKPAIDHQWS